MKIYNIPPLLHFLLPAKTNLLCVLSLALVMLLSACGNSSLSFRTNMSKSALGSDFGIFVKDDGTVWTWGSNFRGHLGVEGVQYSEQPVQVSGLEHILGVVVSDESVFVLAEDGTVWGWGLFRRWASTQYTPLRITRTEQAVDLFSVGGSAIGIKTVSGAFVEYSFGTDGLFDHCYIYSELSGFVDLTDVHDNKFGDGIAYLKADGHVWRHIVTDFSAAIDDSHGTSCRTITGEVEPISGLTNIVSLGDSIQGKFMVLTNDGYVLNSYSERVAGLEHITQLAGNADRWAALGANGRVFVSPSLVPGSLKGATTNQSSSPVLLENSAFTVVDMSVGPRGFVLIDDGNVGHVFGRAVNDPRKMLTPQLVPGLPLVQQISAGTDHALALGLDGRVWGWGDNRKKQIQNSDTPFYDKPVVVDGVSDITSVQAGDGYSVVLNKDGTVWTWGHSGTDLLVSSDTPQAISDIPSIKAVALSFDHIMVLSDAGDAWAWGSNEHGQLGDGTLIDRVVPVRVVGLGDVKDIAVSSSRSFAISHDGNIWIWGDTYGQIPQGTAAYISTIPIQVPNLPAIDKVSAGFNSNVALDFDGNLWSWGFDFGRGSLGREITYSSANELDPAIIPDMPKIDSIYSTGFSSVVVDVKHHVWTWGANFFLESPEYTVQKRPLEVVTGNMLSLNFSFFSTQPVLGVDTDNRAWSWGEYKDLEACCSFDFRHPYMSFRLN